jgi:phage terminase Nu1 subunit (DNA packaging protein)
MSKTNTKRGASSADAARHVGLSDVSFGKLINIGVIERQDRVTGYDLTKVRLKCFAHLRSVAAGRGGVNSGEMLSHERAMLAKEQRETITFKNAIVRGDYVSVPLFKKQLVTDLTVTRERALSLAGKVADALKPHTPKDRSAIYDVIKSEVYEMLGDMANPPAYVDAKVADQVASGKKG